MAKPEKNLSFNVVSVQTEDPKSGGPEGQETGEDTQGSNALSQYWDYENWLQGKDMRIFAPQQLLRNSGSCVPLLNGSGVPRVLARAQWTFDTNCPF